MVFEDGTLFIDNSTLDSVATCELRAMLRYFHNLKKIEAESAPLRCGTAIHAAIETLWKGEPVATALIAFDDEYEDFAHDNVGADDKYAHENLRPFLEYYLETHRPSRLPFHVIPSLVEVGFQQPLTPEISLTGRIDAIVKLDDMFYPLDHKTTGRMDFKWLGKFENGSQLTGYLWGVEQQLGYTCGGAFVNGIEIIKVPSSNRKCQKHNTIFEECGVRHPKAELTLITRTPDQTMLWKKQAVRLAKRFLSLTQKFPDKKDIKKIPSRGMFIEGGSPCVYCDFKEFCTAGRPLEFLDSMFEVNEWRPFIASEKQIEAPKKPMKKKKKPIKVNRRRK